MITNISTGVDPARIQNKEAPFFVCWRQDEKNEYAFFHNAWAAESMRKSLEKLAVKMKDEEALRKLAQEFDYRPQEGLTDGQGRSKYYPGYWVECLEFYEKERRAMSADKS